jgi:hypothetical protein
MLLVPSSEASPEAAERNDALAELGWVNGRNIEIVARYADGAVDRVPALMAELVSLNPDVILTHTGEAARAAADATKMIPVIVGAAGEEAMLDLAGSLGRPQGNVTGLTLVSLEQHAKVVELLKQAQPSSPLVSRALDLEPRTALTVRDRAPSASLKRCPIAMSSEGDILQTTGLPVATAKRVQPRRSGRMS